MVGMGVVRLMMDNAVIVRVLWIVREVFGVRAWTQDRESRVW